MRFIDYGATALRLRALASHSPGARFGLDGFRTASPLRRDALACVAFPTCPLAMAEAERYLPDLVARIEVLLERHGLADAPILLRVSGCPNGCSRPYLGEIMETLDGLFARYAGGRGAGERFGDFLVRAGIVPARDVARIPMEIVT